MSVAQKDILNGWKEIAGYVARDIRTVERWEKQRGLPVRRVPGSGRATVYARISELEEWLASKPLEGETSSLSSVPSSDEDALTESRSAFPHAVEAPFLHTESTIGQPAPVARSHTFLFSAIGSALIALLAGVLYLQHSRAVAAVSRPAQPVSSRLETPRSSVPGVEESYLRGSYLYEQRTPESLAQALDSFNSAIQHDPNFAPAYAGLAETYNLLREYSVMPDAEAYPKAREAAQRAIALDPKLADAHTSLGFATFFWYMNATQAENEFRTGISLDPTSAQAHHWYGTMLLHEGRYKEALRELDIAQHLQPASSAILTSRALALGLSGRTEQARAMLRDLLSHDRFGQDPNSWTAHAVLRMLSVAGPKDWTTWFAQSRAMAALRDENKELLTFANLLERAYKQGGEHAMWEAQLNYEKAHHPYGTGTTWRMVQAEANLGNLDAAFSGLNHMVDRHDVSLDGLSIDPLLTPLRSDPRYFQLRARLGLPNVPA